MPLMRGFTLPEALLATATGSLLLLAGSRLLPMLQLITLQEAQQQYLEDTLWRLAATIGKTLQRAGYCHSECRAEGLRLVDGGRCVIAWREKAFGAGSEQVGYRLKGGALETFSGKVNCAGVGWEKMSDAERLWIDTFQVRRVERPPFAPRITVMLRARAPQPGSASVEKAYSVSGFNL
jgi:prepilin peptidase dependent protein B